MDTKKVKALLLAIEENSMARAAARLSYTPSALSHMADSLEAELGVKILTRGPSGIGLTKDGERLYPLLRAVIDSQTELLNEAKKLAELNKYELRIGSYASISKSILPEIIKSFRDAYPEIKVSLTVGDNVMNLLHDGEIDIAFASEAALKGTDATFIATDPYVAIVPKDAFVGRSTVKREELYAHPYIYTNQFVLQNYFDFSKFPELINIYSEDDTSIISLVREGIAITVLPSTTVKGEKKGIRTLKLDPPTSRRIGFAHNVDEALEKNRYATKKFIDFISKTKINV